MEEKYNRYNEDLYTSDQEMDVEYIDDENDEIDEIDDTINDHNHTSSRCIYDPNKIQEIKTRENVNYITDEILNNSDEIITINKLTLYEKSEIIGYRAKELYNEYEKGEFMPNVKITSNMIKKNGEIDFIKIADKELKEGQIDLYIMRKFPNDRYSVVDLSQLILI